MNTVPLNLHELKKLKKADLINEYRHLARVRHNELKIATDDEEFHKEIIREDTKVFKKLLEEFRTLVTTINISNLLSTVPIEATEVYDRLSKLAVEKSSSISKILEEQLE